MNEKKLTAISNNFFNPKLFIEAIKQLKAVGITSLVCVTLFTVLGPILGYSDMYYEHSDNSMYLADIIEYWSPLFVLLYVIVPLMTIMIFRFLSNRKGSDFYHSLPIKRTCLFLTFISAVIAWAFIIIFWYTFLFSITLNIFAYDLVIDLSVAITFSINLLIGCILIAAVFSISCSISGTIFTNVITGGMILLLPSIISIIFFELGYNYYNPFVTVDTISPWLDPYSNIVLAPLYETASLHDSAYFYQQTLTSFSFPTLYTLGLAIIYVIIGRFAFKKRPSESAGKAFSYNYLSYVYIFFIGYMISLANVVWFYENLKEDYFNIYVMNIMIYLFAATVMFICEIINSRSFKRGFKIFLSSPIIIALDAITVVLLLFTSSTTTNDKIDAEDIDYVYINMSDNMLYESRYFPDSLWGDMFLNEAGTNTYYRSDSFLTADSYYYDYYTNVGYDYATHLISNTKITDPEVIKYLVNLYNKQVDCITRYKDEIYYYLQSNYLLLTLDDTFSDEKCILYLSEIEVKQLLKLLSDYKPFTDCLTEHIEYDSDSTIYGRRLTSEQSEEVYKLLIQEYSTLDYKNHLTLRANWYQTDNTNDVCTITLSEYHNGIIVSHDLPVTTLTPKAYALYLEYHNANYKNDLSNISNMVNNEKIYNLSFEFGFSKLTENGILTANNNTHYVVSSTAIFDYIDSREKKLLFDTLTYIDDANFDDIEKYIDEGYYLCYAIVCVDNNDVTTMNHYYDEDRQSDYLCTYGYFLLPPGSNLINQVSEIGQLYE